jgi:hypothetical protein
MREPTILTLECNLQPEHTFTYVPVPFDVPANITRIDVAYHYEGAISSDPLLTGGNTIDIGLIDPRGSQFMTRGFRGWSGSARKEFTLSTDAATAGYLAGPIQAGTWNICLGAYKVAPDGCRVMITVSLHHTDITPAAEFPPLLTVRTTSPRPQSPDHWYKGELHCHTVHSDGDSTVDEVIAIAKSLGLDFLAITDHNNRSHLAELARLNTDLILIPGYEVTTYYGHWNIWGDGAWIDFRVQSPADLDAAMREAWSQGYLVSCNHPRPHGPDWEFPEVTNYACVEVWNGPWILRNEICLAFWEAQLKQGRRLVAVGGSDFHMSHRAVEVHLANPTTYIYCPEPPTAAALLKHLRSGHAFVTESPTGPHLDLRTDSAMMGDAISITQPQPIQITATNAIGAELQLLSASGLVQRHLITHRQETFEYTITAADALYLRAQIIDPATGHCRAISNPIYLDG